MRVYFLLFFLCYNIILSWSQTPDLSKYNEGIKNLKKTVKYLKIEKINDAFYMVVGGGGNVGVFVSDKNVIMIDNKYEIIENVMMSTLR